MDVSRAIGVLGGTFDPVHYGHLAAAQEAAMVLSLDRVLFLPANDPPHKRDEPVTAAANRAAMVRLAIADNPLFEICEIELERPGPSYTVDSLRTLHARLPDIEIYFIVGMDSLADLPTWHDPMGILELACIAAIYRPGSKPVDLKIMAKEVPGAESRVRLIATPGLDIASTDLRARLRDGNRPVRYLLPDAVIEYIEANGLYR
ncbi:MAG: nadD [Chloroflexi bacterium]|nr:nadD [Chloroflexota bacterium]